MVRLTRACSAGARAECGGRAVPPFSFRLSLGRPGAAVGERDAVSVGDGHAEAGPRAGRCGGGEFAAQLGVERAEAVALAGPFGQPEQRGEGEHQVREPREPAPVREPGDAGRATTRACCWAAQRHRHPEHRRLEASR